MASNISTQTNGNGDLKVSICEEQSKRFVDEFLKHYLENGLGTMTKREVDILVMNLLWRYGNLPEKSNHFLSIKFQMTESQVRHLRYEADLKYPPTDKKYIEIQFLKVLARSKFVGEKDKERIVFVLDDDYLRYEIQGRLKEKGLFADSSFNSEIIKIDHKALKVLIHDMYGKDTANKFDKEFEKVLRGGLKFEGMKKIVVESALQTLAGAITAGALTYIKSIVGL
jgi:hypothetical protein